MAQIETWLYHDLLTPVNVHYLDGCLFADDANGNVFSVYVTKNGIPVGLSGTVGAWIMLADGSTVKATGGTISGNIATIAIPAGAYAVPGRVSIAIRLTSNGDVLTLAVIVANVFG